MQTRERTHADKDTNQVRLRRARRLLPIPTSGCLDGRLPACLITVRPHRGAYGYFSDKRFGSRDGNQIHDEIALNIRHFQQRSPRDILSTMVYEMVALEQFHFGEPSRSGYATRNWPRHFSKIRGICAQNPRPVAETLD